MKKAQRYQVLGSSPSTCTSHSGCGQHKIAAVPGAGWAVPEVNTHSPRDPATPVLSTPRKPEGARSDTCTRMFGALPSSPPAMDTPHRSGRCPRRGAPCADGVPPLTPVLGVPERAKTKQTAGCPGLGLGAGCGQVWNSPVSWLRWWWWGCMALARTQGAAH